MVHEKLLGLDMGVGIPVNFIRRLDIDDVCGDARCRLLMHERHIVVHRFVILCAIAFSYSRMRKVVC